MIQLPIPYDYSYTPTTTQPAQPVAEPAASLDLEIPLTAGVLGIAVVLAVLIHNLSKLGVRHANS